MGETVSSNVLNAFGIAYLSTHLKMPNTVALNGIMIASALGIFACPIFGWISDRVGRRPVFISGAIFLVVFAIPYFMLLNTKVPALIWLAIIVGYIFGPTLMYSVESVFMTELFGTRVRYTGLSLASQLGAIAGGFTPLICTALLGAGGGKPWFSASYLIVIALISTTCIYVAKETFKKDISESETQMTDDDQQFLGNVNSFAKAHFE